MDAFQEVGVAAEMAARSTAPYFGADEDHRLLLAATYQKWAWWWKVRQSACFVFLFFCFFSLPLRVPRLESQSFVVSRSHACHGSSFTLQLQSSLGSRVGATSLRLQFCSVLFLLHVHSGWREGDQLVALKIWREEKNSLILFWKVRSSVQVSMQILFFWPLVVVLLIDSLFISWVQAPS